LLRSTMIGEDTIHQSWNDIVPQDDALPAFVITHFSVAIAHFDFIHRGPAIIGSRNIFQRCRRPNTVSVVHAVLHKLCLRDHFDVTRINQSGFDGCFAFELDPATTNEKAVETIMQFKTRA
jgi:hypothetical protein